MAKAPASIGFAPMGRARRARRRLPMLVAGAAVAASRL